MTIGVDLGASNLRAGIEKNGLITQGSSMTLRNKDSLDSTLEQLISFLKPYTKQPDIKSIGIGVPSVVDINKGIVYNAANIPSWKEVALKDILETEFSLPVYVNNDVNCFILGEHRFGAVQNFSSVVGMCMGTGLGTGIIINNQLYPGPNCGAGEIGYFPYKERDLEFYTSSNYFEQLYETSAADMHELAKLGDKRALDVWNDFAVHIAQAVMTVMYAYDPEAIVLGGSISKAYSFFERKMKDFILEKFAYPEISKNIKIFQSVNESISLLGASILTQTKNYGQKMR